MFDDTNPGGGGNGGAVPPKSPDEMLSSLTSTAESLKIEGDDLKVKQAAAQSQAKEAQTAWGEVGKEVEAFAKDRPALEAKRAELEATLKALAQDLGKLPVADKLKAAFKKDSDDGDALRQKLKEATDARDAAKKATDRAREAVAAARKELDDLRRRRDERKALLTALEKAIGTSKGALDKAQGGEAWMRWRLEIDEPPPGQAPREALGKKATAALDEVDGLTEKLKAAWNAWLAALQDVGAKELTQAQAERPVAPAEAVVKDWETKRAERLLKRAAEIQAGG